jgi:sporulation protein YlmC with PRC-barrel domain
MSHFAKAGQGLALFFKYTFEYSPKNQVMEKNTNEKESLFRKENLTGENQGPLLPNKKGRYLTASSLHGDKVVNPSGEHLGEIRDVMLDLEAGNIDYFIIEFGGFLGIGVKLFAIPLRLLVLDAANKRFIFNQSREILEKAPGFDMEHWPDTNIHLEEVYSYWRFI